MSDYKFVIPATAENIEVRLGCLGLDPAQRMFLDPPARARLNLFLRFGFTLVTTDEPPFSVRIASRRPNPNDLSLKLTE